MPMRPTAPATGLAEEWADWFFKQREFAIRHGRIRWVDDLRQAPPLELSELDLVLRNGLRQHSVRLDATPPPAWGGRFSLQGQFNQSLLKRAGELQFWTGQLYADLPRTDLRELRRHVGLPFELSEGDGALRAWIDIKNGSPLSATVDMGLRAVKLRLGSKGPGAGPEPHRGPPATAARAATPDPAGEPARLHQRRRRRLAPFELGRAAQAGEAARRGAGGCRTRHRAGRRTACRNGWTWP